MNKVQPYGYGVKYLDLFLLADGSSSFLSDSLSSRFPPISFTMLLDLT